MADNPVDNYQVGGDEAFCLVCGASMGAAPHGVCPECKPYTDDNGNPISLDTLCRREPLWAANRIREASRDLRMVLNKAREQHKDTIADALRLLETATFHQTRRAFSEAQRLIQEARCSLTQAQIHKGS